MKTQFISAFRRTASIVWAIAFLGAVTVTHAATRVIQFGGALGDTYSPSTLTVSVGDTIQWVGSFGSHPLSSLSVPTGAKSFHQATGNVFSYPVSVAGAYTYKCDYHVSLGMDGSFVATTIAGVENNQTASQPNAFRLEQNYPNPFNPSTLISFDLPIQTFVSLKVYNLIGQEVATLVNEQIVAGRYSKTWNAGSMTSGVYFYRLQTASFSETKKLIITK
jgi:plastocyanin